MFARVYEHGAFQLSTFADNLFCDEFVSDIFADHATFPSSQSCFNALTVRPRSTLSSFAMLNVSAFLCFLRYARISAVASFKSRWSSFQLLPCGSVLML